MLDGIAELCLVQALLHSLARPDGPFVEEVVNKRPLKQWGGKAAGKRAECEG